jgi:hypothetical protein
MPKTDASQPSEELLLAALERAQLHQRGGDDRGVVLSILIEHLDLPRNSATSRRLRPKLDAVETAGLVRRVRAHCITAWALSEQGRQWLALLRGTGDLGPLPEAPQHRRWREARSVAETRLPGFRHELERALDLARLLLDDSDRAVTSEDWFALSEHLHESAWRVGSATYCSGEWAEPDDERADHDPPTMHGRRDVHRWK